MEITPLRHLLRSLCNDSPWEYAVFWKLKHRSRMLLNWEDGYCNYSKPRDFVESMSDILHNIETNGLTSFDCENDVSDGISAGYPVGLAVASMSCLLYSLGEGFVGRAASTGKDCWIYADEFESKLFPECPEDLQLQIAVGIKTVLHVPVIPHGVVQLGSLLQVTEDRTTVARIKDMFNTFQCNSGPTMLSTPSRDLPAPSALSLRSSLLEKSTSSSSFDVLNSIHSEMREAKDQIALDGVEITQNELAKYNTDVKFQFIGQDYLQVQSNNIDSIMAFGFGDLTMDTTAVSYNQNQLWNENHLDMMGLDAPDLAGLEENLRVFSHCNFNEHSFSALTNMGMNISPYYEMVDHQFEAESGQVTDQKSLHGFLNFPTECELHKALGPSLQQSCNDYLWIPNGSGDDVRSSSICNTDFTGSREPSAGVSKGDADNLLDAMVSYMCDASGDIASVRSNSIRSPTSSSGQIAASCQTQQSQSGCSQLGENDSGPWSSVRTGFVSRQGKDLTKCPSKSSLKRSRANLIAEEQEMGFGCILSRKDTKPCHIGQKKARNSDVQKPRPRDRQLIQDRVKELRELVPNGGKCSIDSLLDQTIKHMLFLRSVTNRAEKLKQCVYTDAVDKKNLELFEDQGKENGASWAVEMGSQLEVCPIVVKDLEQPGHMLIEMLCEENEVFLEIAQVIRRLELTIVKGVMENRVDKSWAHFIVEASTGFRRLDIFWPLMQLLQRNSSVSVMI
ncbi:hypothetical protein IFM89_037195 [Coptis chinensis]|uniref:BHLH domain-containing protein n=1 Tax=Coptis chinensis TaxID=261450 RepID=A0A835HHB5_9MAGN|nr:hypothetical protein IFM89_037195 [Coptis chinensis]